MKNLLSRSGWFRVGIIFLAGIFFLEGGAYALKPVDSVEVLQDYDYTTACVGLVASAILPCVGSWASSIGTAYQLGTVATTAIGIGMGAAIGAMPGIVADNGRATTWGAVAGGIGGGWGAYNNYSAINSVNAQANRLNEYISTSSQTSNMPQLNSMVSNANSLVNAGQYTEAATKFSQASSIAANTSSLAPLSGHLSNMSNACTSLGTGMSAYATRISAAITTQQVSQTLTQAAVLSWGMGPKESQFLGMVGGATTNWTLNAATPAGQDVLQGMYKDTCMENLAKNYPITTGVLTGAGLGSAQSAINIKLYDALDGGDIKDASARGQLASLGGSILGSMAWGGIVGGVGALLPEPDSYEQYAAKGGQTAQGQGWGPVTQTEFNKRTAEQSELKTPNYTYTSPTLALLENKSREMAQKGVFKAYTTEAGAAEFTSPTLALMEKKSQEMAGDNVFKAYTTELLAAEIPNTGLTMSTNRAIGMPQQPDKSMLATAGNVAVNVARGFGQGIKSSAAQVDWKGVGRQTLTIGATYIAERRMVDSDMSADKAAQRRAYASIVGETAGMLLAHAPIWPEMAKPEESRQAKNEAQVTRNFVRDTDSYGKHYPQNLYGYVDSIEKGSKTPEQAPWGPLAQTELEKRTSAEGPVQAFTTEAGLPQWTSPTLVMLENKSKEMLGKEKWDAKRTDLLQEADVLQAKGERLDGFHFGAALRDPTVITNSRTADAFLEPVIAGLADLAVTEMRMDKQGVNQVMHDWTAMHISQLAHSAVVAGVNQKGWSEGAGEFGQVHQLKQREVYDDMCAFASLGKSAYGISNKQKDEDKRARGSMYGAALINDQVWNFTGVARLDAQAEGINNQLSGQGEDFRRMILARSIPNSFFEAAGSAISSPTGGLAKYHTVRNMEAGAYTLIKTVDAFQPTVGRVNQNLYDQLAKEKNWETVRGLNRWIKEAAYPAYFNAGEGGIRFAGWGIGIKDEKLGSAGKTSEMKVENTITGIQYPLNKESLELLDVNRPFDYTFSALPEIEQKPVTKPVAAAAVAPPPSAGIQSEYHKTPKPGSNPLAEGPDIPIVTTPRGRNYTRYTQNPETTPKYVTEGELAQGTTIDVYNYFGSGEEINKAVKELEGRMNPLNANTKTNTYRHAPQLSEKQWQQKLYDDKYDVYDEWAVIALQHKVNIQEDGDVWHQTRTEMSNKPVPQAMTLAITERPAAIQGTSWPLFTPDDNSSKTLPVAERIRVINGNVVSYEMPTSLGPPVTPPDYPAFMR